MDGRMLLGVSGNRGGQPGDAVESLIRRHNSRLLESEFDPRFDWSETPEAHILIADLPGFRKGDVSVQIDNWGNLTISGQRRSEETTTVGWGPWQRTERRPGQAFRKLFSTPDNVNFDAISAKFEHEILYVIMPKLEAAEPEIPARKDDQPRTDVDRSGPGDTQMPPAPTEAERPPVTIQPEGDDRNQRGSASEAESIQIPHKGDDDGKDDEPMQAAGGDQRAISESEGVEGIVSPPTVHEKESPPELNIEAQQKERSDHDQEPPVEKLLEGSDELPTGSSISEEESKAQSAHLGPAEAENRGAGFDGQALPLALGNNSTDERRQARGGRFKLPAFSKRNVVLVSSVLVLSLGIYMSYRLRSTND